MDGVTAPNLGDFDVDIILEGEQRVGCHKRVLSKHSRYFEDAVKNQRGRVTLNLTSMKVGLFRKLCQFMYADYLVPEVTVDDSLDLLDPAIKYRMDGLKTAVVAKLKSEMMDEDVIKVLKVVAAIGEVEELYEYAVGVICERPQEFLETTEFLELQVKEVRAVLDSEDLQVDTEMDVIDAAMRWSDYQSEQATKKRRFRETRSYFFYMLFSCVRWPLLKPKSQIHPFMVNGEFIETIQFALLKIICGMMYRAGLQEAVEYSQVKWWRRGQDPGSVYEHVDSEMEEEEVVVSGSDSGVSECGSGVVGEVAEVVMPAVQENMEVEEQQNPRLDDVGQDVIPAQTPPPEMASLITGLRQMQTSQVEVPGPSTDDRPRRRVGYAPRKRDQMPADESSDADDDKDSDDSDCDSSPMTRVVKTPKNPSNYSSFHALVNQVVSDSKGDEPIGTVELTGFCLKDTRKMIPVADNADITVDGTSDEILGEEADQPERVKSLVKFIRHLDVLEYLVFKPKSVIGDVKCEDLWGLKQNILVRFNGVNFLKVDHERHEIVINYLRDSEEILWDCAGVKSIGVSNSEFSWDRTDSPNKQLEKLNLYRVWGNFNLEEVFTSFPNLKEFRAWRFMPDDYERSTFPEEYSQRLVVCLPRLFPYGTLRVLALSGVVIRLEDGFKMGEATNIEELKLEECRFVPGNCGVSFCELVPKLFPNLRNLFLEKNLRTRHAGQHHVTTVHTVYGALQIPSLKTVRVIGLEWEYDDLMCACELEVSELFEQADVAGVQNFVMKKGTGAAQAWNEGWTITRDPENLDELDAPDQDEMDWHELTLFYENLEAFQLYMIQNQDGVFPKREYF